MEKIRIFMLNDDEMMKELITLSVEHALLKMGTPELELVKSRLKNKYNCELSDCLKYPEYLKIILNELFGNAYPDILETINTRLKRTSLDKPIVRFLTIMGGS
jgi:hypothetical protein